MQHLESVECTDDRHSRWVARLPGGKHLEWQSEIVNDEDGRLIAWKTVGDPDIAHAGSVHFTPKGDGSTELRIVFDYEPPFARTIAGIASHLQLDPATLVDGDLRRFRDYVETRPQRATVGGD
jgi:uncharacterized membrane protein